MYHTVGKSRFVEIKSSRHGYTNSCLIVTFVTIYKFVIFLLLSVYANVVIASSNIFGGTIQKCLGKKNQENAEAKLKFLGNYVGNAECRGKFPRLVM